MAALGHWRSKAQPIIREVLERTRGQSEQEIAKALYDAYPFGLRQYHPYKIWLDEIHRQRGTKPKHPTCRCGHGHGSHRGECKAADCRCEAYHPGNPDQAEMFGEEATRG